MFKEKPDAPIGFGDKIKAIIKYNFRGIFGILVPFCGLIWRGQLYNHARTLECMWIFIAWVCLLQPVHLPIAGLIPIFVLPMAGVVSTKALVSMYINESLVVFLLGSMVNLLLNNSGFDRRVELNLLRSGDNSAYNPRKLVLKSATAAFLLSIFSSRQIVSSDLVTFLAPPLIGLGSPGIDMDNVRAIICCAIHTGAAIGSFVFPHGSMTVLIMRQIFYGSPKYPYDYPDVFNYMQYVMFAFPVALVMFVLSTIYYMILIGKQTLSPAALAKIGGALDKHHKSIPNSVTLHEIETVIAMALFLILCIFRWCKFLDMGWSTFAKDDKYPTIPRVRDATICSFMVLLLFSLPKGYGWVKYLTASKYKDLPPNKPESGILFWRFVDKKILYGYIFMFGASQSISAACLIVGKVQGGPDFPPLGTIITENLGKVVTDHPWNLSIFIVCFVSVLLGNIMPGIAAAVVWCPFIANMCRAGAPRNWETKSYLGLLAAGIGTGLGFMCPFMHTTAYFTHYVGKIPKVKMAKTSAGAVIICFIILWLAMCYVAPYFWDQNDEGFVAIIGPDSTTGAGGGGGAGAAPAAPAEPGAPPPPPPPPPPEAEAEP